MKFVRLAGASGDTVLVNPAHVVAVIPEDPPKRRSEGGDGQSPRLFSVFTTRRRVALVVRAESVEELQAKLSSKDG